MSCECPCAACADCFDPVAPVDVAAIRLEAIRDVRREVETALKPSGDTKLVERLRAAVAVQLAAAFDRIEAEAKAKGGADGT